MFEALTSLTGGGGLTSSPSSAAVGGTTGGVTIRAGSVYRGPSLPTLVIVSIVGLSAFLIWKKM